MIAIRQNFKRLAGVSSIACFFAMSSFAINASAQTRAALVRDTDNAALAPVSFCNGGIIETDNSGSFATTIGTVPAAKRFVLQNVSYVNLGSNTGSLRYGYLGSGLNSLFINHSRLYLPITASLQAASFPATAYFEAGENIDIAITGDPYVGLAYCVTGYYITP